MCDEKMFICDSINEHCRNFCSHMKEHKWDSISCTMVECGIEGRIKKVRCIPAFIPVILPKELFEI
jgi:hypothetical protein